MRRPTRILTLAVIAPLTAVALAACTQGAPLPGLPTGSPSPTPTPTVAAGPPAATIAALAQREVGTGTVVSMDDEADGAEWQARVVLPDGSVQEVHLADDGTVLAGPSPDTVDARQRSDNRALVAAASIGLAAAQRRMQAAVPGGRVTAIELDREADGVVWRGDVLDRAGVRHDVRVDAVSGGVVLDRADATTPPGGS